MTNTWSAIAENNNKKEINSLDQKVDMDLFICTKISIICTRPSATINSQQRSSDKAITIKKKYMLPPTSFDGVHKNRYHYNNL